MTGSDDSTVPAAHMLDGCDPDECYKTMMTERTDLIKARREAEDNLVKTVIQLSATLVALISGFITQTSVTVLPQLYPALIAALGLLLLALTSGLLEHRFSSKAYLAQQQLVEAFYTRQINEFTEPAANKWVRRSQASSFVCFIFGLLALGIFAVLQAGEKTHGRSKVTTSSATTATTAAAAAAAAHACELRRQGARVIHSICSTQHASAPSQKEVITVEDSAKGSSGEVALATSLTRKSN